MKTHIGVGLDDHHDGATCGQQAARAARAALGKGPVALALLFTSHPRPDQVLRGVNEALGDVPVIGTTSAGQYTHQGYVEQGAGVMLIQSTDIAFHPVMPQRRLFGGRKLLGELRGTASEGLGSPFKHRALMIFPDTESMNLDGVVEQAMTETAMLYDILGGAGPSGQAPPRPTAVFLNTKASRAGLSGAEVLSQRPLGLALANGWTPVSGPYRVTRTDKRRVVSIDGRPAWEVYEDFLVERQIAYTGATVPAVLLRHPIGVCPNGDCKVNVLMGVDEDGALMTAAPPPTGSLIYILATQPDAMITAATRAIESAITGLVDQAASGALFIDCMSTAMVLADAYEGQRTAVEQCLGTVPFLGVRSHGVLARLQGQLAGIYECSVGACVLPG